MVGGTMTFQQILTNILGMITPQLEAGLIGIAMVCAIVYGLMHHSYGWFWTSAIAGAGLVSIVWALQTAYGVSV